MDVSLLPALLDEEKCLDQLRRLRWPGGPRCPHCKSGRYWTDREEAPKLQYRCGRCNGWWSDLSGTALEGTRLPLSCWLLVLDALGRGQRAQAVAALLGVHRHTVSRMRRALAQDPLTAALLRRLGAALYLGMAGGWRRRRGAVQGDRSGVDVAAADGSVS